MTTKIMAIGDFHGDASLAKKIAEKADEEEVESIILTGDIHHIDQIMPGIMHSLTKNYRKVFLIPGNHDSNPTLDILIESYPGVENIHGKGIKHGAMGIFGSGYADIGPFGTTEAELKENLERGHKNIRNLKNKIMATHLHPQGSDSEFSGIRGSKSIREAIEKFQPDFVFHGHVHEGGGIEEKIGKTKIFNVARRYKILEL